MAKSDQLFVCFESFVDGGTVPPTPVARGARLRGDHAMVKKHCQYFVPDGTPDDEMHRLRQRMYEDAGVGMRV
jgi:hypothetical protein